MQPQKVTFVFMVSRDFSEIVLANTFDWIFMALLALNVVEILVLY